jgi:hypothetical protein
VAAAWLVGEERAGRGAKRADGLMERVLAHGANKLRRFDNDRPQGRGRYVSSGFCGTRRAEFSSSKLGAFFL